MEVTRECKNYEEALLPDEQVQWTGKAENFPLLSTENKSWLLLRWICSGVMLAALTALYAAAVFCGVAKFNIFVELIVIVACGYVSYLPIGDWSKIRKNVRYYVTNKRVILAVGKSVYALNRSGIKTECKSADGGAVHILFGSCVGMPGRKYRRATVLPEVDDADLSKNGFVFYNVKEGRAGLEKLLSV